MSKQTKSENQIIYICDFRRYEKSSSKKATSFWSLGMLPFR